MCIDFKIKLIFCGEYTPREVGVNLKEGYNGELTSREAGSVGGQMVKNDCPVQPKIYERKSRVRAGHVQLVTYEARLGI